MTAETNVRITEAEWRAEGERRFGADSMDWKFVCPSCGHIAATRDWRDAGAPVGCVAFSCVGRFIPGTKATMCQRPGPCNYAGGGLIGLNPTIVVDAQGKEHAMFAFAGQEAA